MWLMLSQLTFNPIADQQERTKRKKYDITLRRVPEAGLPSYMGDRYMMEYKTKTSLLALIQNHYLQFHNQRQVSIFLT